MARTRNGLPSPIEPDTLIIPGEEIYTEEDAEAREADGVGDLADLDSQEFADWEWTIYRLRTHDQMQRAGSRNQRVWVGRKTGPVNLAEIQAEYGGGWFEFWGKFNGRLAKRYKRELEGEPVVQARPAPVPTAMLAPGGGEMRGPFSPPDRNDRLFRLMLREQRESREQFRELITVLAQRDRVEAKPMGLGEIVQAVAEIKKMSAGERPPLTDNPVEVAKMVLDGFHQGVVLGQEREPLAAGGMVDPNSWAPMIEKGLDILGRVMTARTRPPGAAPARPPSGATVVDEPAAARGPAAATAAAPPEHRWRTAIEAVCRGMWHGRNPEDLADSLEDMLNADEVAMLRGAPGAEPNAEQVIEYLGPVIAEFPDLAKEQGKAYLTAVLSALRSDAADFRS